jgi:co-chaperonin GroES (HSP10)
MRALRNVVRLFAERLPVHSVRTVSELTAQAGGEMQTQETNDLGYLEIQADKFRPLGDRILVKWEQANDVIKAGKVQLLRAETHKKLCFTGIVLKVGPRAWTEVQPGDRILFDQFSDFTRLFDPKYGRLALLDEYKQASAFAVVPARTKVTGGENDFNYDA